MSTDQKNLVLAASTAIAKQRRALVSRGLGDLSRWVRPKARVLLVNDQRALLEELEQILVRAGCEVRSTGSQTDAISAANSFLEAECYGCWPSEFRPQFVMLGLTLPTTLGTELHALHRRISKLILWGEVQDSNDLEQRQEHYDFELLPMPTNAEKLLTQMTAWIAESWTANGNWLDAKKRHSAALECHEEALTVNPLCISAWLNKGFSLSELGRFLDAVESYDRAIGIAPSDWRPWVRKGDTLERVGQHEEAIRCFDAALKLSANLISAWEGKGQALDSLGRYEEAIASYERIFEIDFTTWSESGKAHEYSWAWNLKGAAFSHARRFQDAIESYNRAISLDPKNAEAWYNKGIALMKTSRLGEAIGCNDTALELRPGHAKSWHNKGCCLRDLGRMEEAIACHEKALACDPPEILAWHSKAQALDDCGRLNDAVNSYETYLSVAPIDAQHTKGREHAQARVRILKARIGQP